MRGWFIAAALLLAAPAHAIAAASADGSEAVASPSASITPAAQGGPPGSSNYRPPAPDMGGADRPLPDAAREKQAKGLMEVLRCVVCQSASIADSGAEMAGDMRREVRFRIGSGDTPDQVRQYMISRYGAWISYSPPVTPATFPLWAAPVIILVLGGIAASALFRRRGRAA